MIMPENRCIFSSYTPSKWLSGGDTGFYVRTGTYVETEYVVFRK